MTDNIKQELQANNSNKNEGGNKKLNISKMIKKMDKPKEHYTQEEMDELEEFAKKYKEFIVRAKERNKKYEKAKEKNRRTHQMCEFGGKIEEAYKTLYGEYYWTEDNKAKIDEMLKMIINYYENEKNKNHPIKKENPQTPQTATTKQPAQPQVKTAP